nr:hypothetical protein [Tanacetum cinerariifolium]
MDFVEKAIMERGLHKKAHDSKVNERTMQTQVGMVNMVKDKCDVGLVVTEINKTKLENQDESSRSGNDTQAEGANIGLSSDTKPLNEVQTTAAYNVFVNDKQHVEHPKFINKRNVDQDAEQYLDKRPLLGSIIENKTAEYLNQTLESENDCLKMTIAQLQTDFSKLKPPSIAFEIALQHKTQENNSLKTL